MSQVLRRLSFGSDPRVLVGAATADDAGVFRLDARRALVQTVDFFTPIVDDPFRYGQIAAANSLSDVFAMGGRPLTALNIMGIPEDRVPPEAIHEILRGGAAKAREAGCAIVGGHTIKNPEPIYGLAVTGLVDPRRMMTNARARPGDILVLTKPIGTGIVTTGIKRGLASPRAMRVAIATMARLNAIGADLAGKGWVCAGTDVTGFGLLGHLGSLCRASGVGATIEASAVPLLPDVEALIERGSIPGGTQRNLDAAMAWTRFESGVTEAQRMILADAQTSGGLLLCVPPRRFEAVVALLRSRKTPCVAAIGRVTKTPRAIVRVVP